MLTRSSLCGNLCKFHRLARAVTAARTQTAPAISAVMWKARSYHEVVGDIISPSQVHGIDHIRDPRLNKGLAFSLEERQMLGIHGMQPACFTTQEEQLRLCKIAVGRYMEPVNKYLYLSDLHDRNERLFFRFLAENIEDLMPIVSTPTAGLACQRFGLIYRRPHGLFVTYNDRGHIYDLMKNWPEPNVHAICVTDGERIAGFGDLGACAMGIPVGKLALYTALAGIKPHQCLPIVLDVGTDNVDLLADPLYVGLRHKRIVGREYNEFVDEFMEAVIRRYGRSTLIQFEDFGKPNAVRLLDKYRYNYCVMNDDIQSTAAVAVAGLYASNRITGRAFKDNKFLFAGAGAAAIGIADLLVKAMLAEGLTPAEAHSKIYMMDSDGLLSTRRKVGNLDGPKANYAKNNKAIQELDRIVTAIKPNVLIGATGCAGLFTPRVLRKMAFNNDRPVVFTLSSPTSHAECTAEQAYQNTKARVIFSSGAPFPPVTIEEKTYYPGHCNNAYIFPGLALGIICAGMHHIPDDMFLIAAQELANFVDISDMERGSLYPPLQSIRELSIRIAIGVIKGAYDKGLASTYPEPQDKAKWLEDQLYNFDYESAIPATWSWPRVPYAKTDEESPQVATNK